MATKKERRDPPRLRGSPARLSGFLQLDQLQVAPTLAPVADFPEIRVDPAWVAVHREPESAVAEIELGLPETTPPGSYLAAVPIEGDDYQIVVEVEPRIRLRMSPRRLNVQAHAGEKVGTEVTIFNQGNVPAPIPRTLAMGLFDTFGLDRAIGRAFRGSPPKGERRGDILIDELAREHGGLMTIKIKGPQQIPPGEIAGFELELHVPAKAEHGRTYFGFVRLHEMAYDVHVDVLEGSGEASVATS
jgi:hypothetical protein